MLYRIFALCCFFSPLMIGQSIHSSKRATVHVYRQGELLIPVSIFADGNNVAALSPHGSATFSLVPGYHELTMQSGEMSPTASFKAVAGREYFLCLEYAPAASATSLRDLRARLSVQPEGKGADQRHIKPVVSK
jgi:hypothetical protein